MMKNVMKVSNVALIMNVESHALLKKVAQKMNIAMTMIMFVIQIVNLMKVVKVVIIVSMANVSIFASKLLTAYMVFTVTGNFEPLFKSTQYNLNFHNPIAA